MLKLKEDVAVYVAEQPVDFRKAINGLSVLIVEQFETTLNDGSVYVFYNRERTQVKCLFWDRNGFVMVQKRLERGSFKMEKTKVGSYCINQKQLDWLLAGLDFNLMEQFSELDYTDYF